MTITVHTKKPCVQCDATFRNADKLGLDYEVEMLEEMSVEEVEKFKALGHMQAPVVTVAGEDGAIIDIWHGFNPDKIKKYADKQTAARGELASV